MEGTAELWLQCGGGVRLWLSTLARVFEDESVGLVQGIEWVESEDAALAAVLEDLDSGRPMRRTSACSVAAMGARRQEAEQHQGPGCRLRKQPGAGMRGCRGCIAFSF